MKEHLREVQFAALLHDIGKFAWRAGVSLIRKDYPELSAGHAKWSADFVGVTKVGEVVADLVLYHHDREASTYPELMDLIQSADHFSAKERERDDSENVDVRKEPLVSIFSKVALNGVKPDERFHQITILSPSAELYPRLIKADTREGWHLQPEYDRLWRDFNEEVGRIPPQDGYPDFHTLLFLLEKYTSLMPSAAYKAVPDVSLYDHLRITCAIADCLTKDNEMLLIKGDIPQIQNFVYSTATKGALKAVRGRSFFIQLASEAIASWLCKQLGLTPANIIFAGGGHFYILAPKSVEPQIKELWGQLQCTFLSTFHGELTLAMGWTSIGRGDFENFKDKWRMASEKLREEKLRQFSGMGYKVFEPYGQETSEELCHACGSDVDVKEDKEGNRFCGLCRSFGELATSLSRSKFLWELEIKPDNQFEGTDWRNLFAKLGLYYTFDKDEMMRNRDRASHVLRYALNNFEFLPEGLEPTPVPFTYGFKLAPNYVPRVDGAIKGLDEYASEAEGLKRWGVLKGDVDSLGQIFAEGLGDHATISRTASLSRMLSLFFVVMVERIVKEGFEDKALIVYSGGDDFVIVGPWSILPELAHTIRREFERFTGGNPSFTVSMCIEIAQSEKEPFYHVVNRADAGLTRAKAEAKFYRDLKSQRDKNALAFLGEVIPWEKWEGIKEFKEELIRLLVEKGESKAFLYKLMAIHELYENGWKKASAKYGGNPGSEAKTSFLAKNDARYNRWKWILAYMLKRKNREDLKPQIEENIEYLGVVSKWVELSIREEV